MNRKEIEAALRVGEELYRQLLEAASFLLEKLDVLTVEDLEAVMIRRQQIVQEIQRIDDMITSEVSRGETGKTVDGLQINHFREQQKQLTERILELDAVSLALANKKLAVLQKDFTAISDGRTLRKGYDPPKRSEPQQVNGKA